jgi:hypothetical protein
VPPFPSYGSNGVAGVQGRLWVQNGFRYSVLVAAVPVGNHLGNIADAKASAWPFRTLHKANSPKSKLAEGWRISENLERIAVARESFNGEVTRQPEGTDCRAMRGQRDARVCAPFGVSSPYLNESGDCVGKGVSLLPPVKLIKKRISVACHRASCAIYKVPVLFEPQQTRRYVALKCTRK